MLAAGSGGGAAPTPSPPKSRGGGGRSPAPSAPAPTSSGGGDGSSASTGYTSYDAAPAKAARPQQQAPDIAKIIKAFVPQDVLKTAFPEAKLPKFEPGAVAEAEADLESARGEENGRPLPLVNAYGVRVSNPQPETDTGYEGSVADAKEDLAEAERARRRRAVRPDIQGEGRGEVKRMTQEEYDKLSDRERAAIDFNTMLVGSVRQDKRMQDTYDPSKKQRSRYEDLVTKMFGEDGDSEKYAPETVAMLNQIEFRDEAADLDDFLGLRAAITKKDIKNMTNLPSPDTEAAAESIGEVKLDRMQLTEGLVDSTEQMQAALVEGNRMLSTINRTAAGARSEHVNMLGGEARDVTTLGFGQPRFEMDGSPSNLDTYFQVAYDKLANAKSTKPGEFDFGIEALRSDLSPSEFNAFLGYSRTRAENAERYGIELGDNPDSRYRSPEAYRDLLNEALHGPTKPERPAPTPEKQPAPVATAPTMGSY